MKWSRPQRLEIRQLLGQGWAGDVYVAQAPDTSEQVAVRLVAEGLVPEIGRLLQVLQAGATLGLPHVLPTTLPEAFDGQLFYAMPLADQGSLRSVLERVAAAGSHLDPLTALDITRQVAEALAAAHTQGVLHGNLKPENVLLWGRPPEGFDVQVSDFGLNTLRVPDATSPYLSPEGQVGAPTSVQDDLYSVGAMLYEMLTTRPLPLTPQPIDLQGLPEVLRKLLGRCFGWPMPFSDVAAFLGQLRAVRAVVEASLSGAGVQLLIDPPNLSVQPGATQSLQVRLSAAQDASVLLAVEGWPEHWVKLPTPPALPMRAGSELVTAAEFLVPRSFEIAPKTYEASVLALGLLPTGERELLARSPVQISVLPFEASALSLKPTQQQVGRAASVGISLTNEGNVPQQYHLAVTVPAGAVVRGGSLGRQFELQAGAEYHDNLELLLPFAFLRGREVPLTAVAHTRPSESATWPPPQASVQASAKLWQRPSVPLWAAGVLLLGLLGGTMWAAQPPRIEAFALQGPPPAKGEPFTLAWQTAGAKQVQILELPHVQLGQQGAHEFAGLGAEQTYTLVARGWLTQRTQQVTVRPTLPLPRVTTFTVSPANAKVGEVVTVRWDVQNAERVSLTPFGVVPTSGSRQVKLSRDTTFTLTAQQGKTPSSADVVSRLSASVGAPQIQVFEITPASVQRGQNVTVRWQTSGAAKVRMAPFGDLPAAGSRTFAPTQTANYTLKASNGQQEILKNVVVTVAAVPTQITGFSVTPASPAVGDPIKVQWRAAGAQQVTLRWGNQQQTLPASGSLTLNATEQMQNMTLVAQGDGEPVLKSVELQIRPAPTQTPPTAQPATNQPAAQPTPAPTTQPAPTTSPVTPPVTPAAPVRISSFSASPARLSVGARTTLSWQVSGVQRVTLIGPDTTVIGRYGPRSSVSFTVKQAGAQTYRLVAGNQVAKVTVTGLNGAVRAPQPNPSSTPKPAPKPAAPAAPKVEIQLFRAQPAALRPSQSATLSWKVVGAKQVTIRGLRGPNPDGSFPPIGTAKTPPASAAQTYVLSAAGVQQTLRIPLLSGPRPAPAPPAPSPTDNRYQALAGEWNHPTGQLNLTVRGNRVTGTLTSNGSDLPSGTLSGTLSGDRNSPTLNAFLGSGSERVALLLSFDSAEQTFRGFYSSRQNRERWCGWRGDNVQSCQ